MRSPKTRESIACLALFLALPVLCSAQQSTAASLADIDGLVAAAMKELRVPGAAVGVIRDGQVLLAKGYGVRVLGGGEPVTANTVFAVGSVTKSFTAASCAAVVGDGKIDWDRPVREYWPWFSLHDPVATNLITLRDLLTHRSGLPRHDFIRFSTPLPRDELLRRLRFLEPSRTFRETFQYNNLMYVAAGFLCADRAGVPWEDLIRNRIFAPLGMAGSTVTVKDSQRLPDFARPHEMVDGQVRATDFYDYQSFGIGPNGAVNSNATDLLKYLQFFLDGGKTGVIPAAQMTQLFTPVTVSGTGAYALGWTLDHYRGHPRRAHGGAITGFTANVAIYPNQKAAVAVLNNLGSALPGLVTNMIADRLLGLEPEDHLKTYRAARDRQRTPSAAPPATGPKPSQPLQAYAGKYTHPAYGTIDVRTEGDALTLVFPVWSSPLRHLRYDTFAIARLGGAPAQFRMDAAGNLAELLLPLEPSVKPFVFRREPQ
jgi:CubicO group peptidase (beta-lactamase class C family)